MHTLKVTLKQHTPMIHFQHDQEGATLRASEVKPKLDRFVVENVFDSDYDNCREFLVGYDPKKPDKLREKFGAGYMALDYKMIVTPRNKVFSSLNPHYDSRKRKYVTEDFPLILSNMGGKESENEIADLSQYDLVDLVFVSKNTSKFKEDSLLDVISSWIDLFFATQNFGQRQDKGFGSFSVVSINGEKMGFPKTELPENTRLLKITFPDEIREIDKQKQLFQVIDFYWKCLKSGINYTRNGQYPNRYIKAYLWTYLNERKSTWEKRKVKETFNLTTGQERAENPNNPFFARAVLGCPDKFEYRNKGKIVGIEHSSEKNSEDYIARIPSPVVFKPIFEGNTVRIYILVDETPIEKLRESKNLVYNFVCDNQLLTMNVDPNVIDIGELIKGYHAYLDNTVRNKAFANEDERESFDQNNEPGGRHWFIPLDFKWRRIITGKNCWVEMYVINKQ